MEWWDILKAVRALEPDINSIRLAESTGMPVRLAAAWLAKLAKWGYLRPTGTAASFSSKRWVRSFSLTKYGKTRKEPTRRVSFVPIKDQEKKDVGAPPKKSRGPD